MCVEVRKAMYTKLIEVLVPYRMCEKCKHFELTDTTLVVDGEPYHTTFYCANQEFCEAILNGVDLKPAE